MTVEMVLSAVFGLLAWRVHDPLLLTGFCWLAAITVCLVFIDLAVRRLPDRLIAIAIAGLTIALAFASLIAHDMKRLLIAGAVGACLALAFLLMALWGGYGRGDVKLAFMTGIACGWFGWPATLFAFCMVLLLAALTGLASWLAGSNYKTGRIPVGPCIAAGSLAALLLYAGT